MVALGGDAVQVEGVWSRIFCGENIQYVRQKCTTVKIEELPRYSEGGKNRSRVHKKYFGRHSGKEDINL